MLDMPFLMSTGGNNLELDATGRLSQGDRRMADAEHFDHQRIAVYRLFGIQRNRRRFQRHTIGLIESAQFPTSLRELSGKTISEWERTIRRPHAQVHRPPP